MGPSSSSTVASAMQPEGAQPSTQLDVLPQCPVHGRSPHPVRHLLHASTAQNMSTLQYSQLWVVCCLSWCREEAQVLFARLMSGYGRDASLNAKERKAPGTLSITQLPGSPTASRCSHFGAEAAEGE